MNVQEQYVYEAELSRKYLNSRALNSKWVLVNSFGDLEIRTGEIMLSTPSTKIGTFTIVMKETVLHIVELHNSSLEESGK